MKTSRVPPLSATLPDIMFLIVALFAAIPGQGVLLNRDGDLARHIRNGQEILRVGPHLTDSFSHTVGAKPFLGLEWLSQVFFALAHRIGGLAMVTVLTSLVLALAYALIARWLILRRVAAPRAAVAMMAAVVLGATHWAARPHLFTVLGLAVLLPMLSGRRGRWWHWALLFGVWSNFHGGFVLGLTLAGAAAAGALLDGLVRGAGPHRFDRSIRLAKGVAAGALATLANPWGPGLHREIVSILGNDYILSVSTEFSPPTLEYWVGRFFLAALVLVAAALAPTLRSARFVALAPVLVLAIGGLSAGRNVSLFGLIAIPLTAVEVSRWLRLRARRARPRARSRARAAPRPPGPAIYTHPELRLAPAVALLLLPLGLTGGRVAGAQVIADTFDPHVFPVEAVRRLRAAGVEGRLFHDFIWGGYLLYAWPEQRIFIDGMTPFFGESLMREYGQVIMVEDGWRDVLERHGVDLVLVRPERRLAGALLADGWKPAYLDSTAVLLRSPDSPVRGCNEALPCADIDIVTVQ